MNELKIDDASCEMPVREERNLLTNPPNMLR